jgi:GNAT superfamily N-acetyltransferase
VFTGLTLTTNGAEKTPNTKAELPALDTRRLTDECSRAAFSCGNLDIDQWFRAKALKEHNALSCRVMTGHLPGNSSPVGFYATTMKMESENALPQEHRSLLRWYSGSAKMFPVMHLRYVAVIRPLQRQGFGTVLMGAAIDDFYEVAVRTGIFALTLVAIDQKTADFYHQLGFVNFGEPTATQPSLLLPALSVISLRENLS